MGGMASYFFKEWGLRPYNDDPSQLSDEDADFEEKVMRERNLEAEKEAGATFLENELDAAVKLPIIKKRIELSDVLLIEQKLDISEKISLSFLLCTHNDPKLLIQELLDDETKNIFHNWAEDRVNCGEENWQNKLLEAVTMIQNFQVLKTLGYKKADLIDRYQPFYAFSDTHLNRFRKVLYLIFEKLNSVKENEFIQLVKTDCANKMLPLFPPYESTELYVLHFIKIGYISETNFKNLTKIFKRMELESIVEMLETLEKDTTKKMFPDQGTEILESKTMDDTEPFNYPEHLRKLLNSENPSTSTRNVLCKFSQHDFDQEYEIDPENPGICIIFNNEIFYSEFDEDVKKSAIKYLPKECLEDRKGTEIDKEKLKNTFEYYGYEVVIFDNKYHLEILTNIEAVIEEKFTKKQSSLVVCILSHGEEKIIYGSNGCAISINEIVDKMCCPKLKNKPKILLLQSCQGSQLQTLEQVDENSLDGPIVQVPLKKYSTDVCIFRATVPGFAAIRSKDKGSWFIQHLCVALLEFGTRYHLEEIAKAVIKTVSDERWNRWNVTQYMVPIIDSTFVKKFYFKIRIKEPLRNY